MSISGPRGFIIEMEIIGTFGVRSGQTCYVQQDQKLLTDLIVTISDLTPNRIPRGCVSCPSSDLRYFFDDRQVRWFEIGGK